MASAAVQQSGGAHTTTFEPLTTVQSGVTKHHVHTKLNYYKPNADGSPPAPAVSTRYRYYRFYLSWSSTLASPKHMRGLSTQWM